jgi:hypothetical protein
VYIEHIIKKFGFLDANLMLVPMDPNIHNSLRVDMDNVDTTFPYQGIMGNLTFASLGTWLDIIYVMSIMAKFFVKPIKTHCATDKCILKYLKGISHLVICFESSSMTHSLIAYRDANYATNLDDKRSRGTYMLF